MSKENFIPSSSGGIPGTWQLLASGFFPFNIPGSEATIDSVPSLPPGVTMVAFVSGDGGGGFRVLQGNTGAVPPAGVFVWCLKENGAQMDLVGRISGGSLNISYVIYSVSP